MVVLQIILVVLKKQEIIFLQSKLTETTIANETESFIADRRQREKSASELKNAEKCNALKAQIRMLEERSELSASALQADVGKKSREITQLKEEVIELKDELGAANMCLNLRKISDATTFVDCRIQEKQ